MSKKELPIYCFTKKTEIKQWQIVNDDVMGGQSSSKISLTEDGYGNFSGQISLANNGGFASVRHFTDLNIKPNHSKIVLYVKGDRKTYQFRLKGDKNQSESYVQEFKTDGGWQQISLELINFFPKYRGRKLDMPNFSFSKIEEIRFLIAHKKEEKFELLIDSITIK